MPIYVPKGIRPAGIVPAAPRVIYKTKRNNLSHPGRIGRIDRSDTLQAFREFSHTFHSYRPRLTPEVGGYLHNSGFLPDKASLYGLPNDNADSYLSDFQISILPMANGHAAPALSNRLIFWRLYNGILPLAPLAGWSDQKGVRATNPPGDDETILSRPTNTETAGVELHTRLPKTSSRSENIFLRLPEESKIGTNAPLLRLIFLFDSKDKVLFVAGATLISGALDQIDTPGMTLVSTRVDPETGLLGSAWKMTRGSTTPPSPIAINDAAWISNVWWPTLLPLLTAFRRVPALAVIQLDVLITEQGPLVIDATDRIDAATQQVHGPLMNTTKTIRFTKEFGV